MTAKARKRGNDQRYYERLMRTRPEVKRANEKRWRANNRERVNESAKRYYYSHRTEVIFRNWLYIQLMKIRAGVIANGGVPFDG